MRPGNVRVLSNCVEQLHLFVLKLKRSATSGVLETFLYGLNQASLGRLGVELRPNKLMVW